MPYMSAKYFSLDGSHFSLWLNCTHREMEQEFLCLLINQKKKFGTPLRFFELEVNTDHGRSELSSTTGTFIKKSILSKTQMVWYGTLIVLPNPNNLNDIVSVLTIEMRTKEPVLP